MGVDRGSLAMRLPFLNDFLQVIDRIQIDVVEFRDVGCDIPLRSDGGALRCDGF